MDSLLDHPWWVLALAALLCIVGCARFTRLLTHDAWPPTKALRERFVAWTEQTRPTGETDTLSGAAIQGLTWRYGWGPLLTCPFCLAPWITLVSLVWAWASGLDVHAFWGAAWWLGHLWFTLAYAAAMVVVRDEPVD